MDYEIIKTVGRLREVCDIIREKGILSFDFETFSENDKVQAYNWWFDCVRPSVIALACDVDKAFVLPLYHREPKFVRNDVVGFADPIFNDLKEIKKLLFSLFSDDGIIKVAHNLKFDLHFLKKMGCEDFKGCFDDTMIMHYMLDETTKHGLKGLVGRFLPKYKGYEETTFNWNAYPLEELSKYAGMDVCLTLMLYYKFKKELKEDIPIYRVYRRLKIPSLFVLLDMEHRGVLIDEKYLEKLEKKAKKYISKQLKKLKAYDEVIRYEKILRKTYIEEEIKNLEEKRMSSLRANRIKNAINYEDKIKRIRSGEYVVYDGVNFGSPKQLAELLYSDIGFGYDVPMVAGERKASTNKEVLNEIGGNFIRDLFIYRSLEKLYSVYIRGIAEKIYKGRIYPSFLLHGTRSHRISCKNPNLQNLPKRSDLGSGWVDDIIRGIRRLFIAPKGSVVVQADFSQAELRIIANFSKDPTMIKAYQKGVDIHTLTASNILGISTTKLKRREDYKFRRFLAKATNFGLIYGQGVDGYRRYVKNNYGTELSETEAKRHIKSFFDNYSRIRFYHKQMEKFVLKHGYVRTLFGSKRRLKEAKSRDKRKQSQAIRLAINSPVQGTSGEMTLFLMCLLFNKLPKKVTFFNTIHDSVLFYCPKNKVKKLVKLVNTVVENLPLKEYFDCELKYVGMKMDFEVGKTWDKLVEI